MKYAILLALAFFTTQAHAATILLGCDGLQNPILDGVRTITINGDKLQLVEETQAGALVGYQATLASKTADYTFHIPAGIEVTVPAALIEGKVQSANVGLATYEYPYESTFCSVIK